MADVHPYRHSGTHKVQDLTTAQAELFPGLYERLDEEPKTDLGEDEGSSPISHTDATVTVTTAKTGD